MIGTNVLVAFPYATPHIVDRLAALRERGANVYIDSGAFSAWNAGRPVDINRYMAWLKSLPFAPTGYFQLDVVGDPVATMANLQTMVDAGLRPIGVYQRGAPESQIAAMYDMVDMISVGGLGGSNNKSGYCKWFMRRTMGRPAHLLGHVSTPTIASTRPTSCDSTNWMFGSRGLAVMLYAGAGKRHGFHRGQYRANAIPTDVLATLKTYNVTTKLMREDAFWGYGMKVLGAQSLIRTSAESERLYGCRIYAACGSIDDLNAIETAWQNEGSKTR